MEYSELIYTIKTSLIYLNSLIYNLLDEKDALY